MTMTNSAMTPEEIMAGMPNPGAPRKIEAWLAKASPAQVGQFNAWLKFYAENPTTPFVRFHKGMQSDTALGMVRCSAPVLRKYIDENT